MLTFIADSEYQLTISNDFVMTRTSVGEVFKWNYALNAVQCSMYLMTCNALEKFFFIAAVKLNKVFHYKKQQNYSCHRRLNKLKLLDAS